MNREEMLRHLGLTEQELRHLLRRYSEFLKWLNEAERATVLRSLPSLEEAAKTFGPDVRAEDLEYLLRLHAPDDAVGVAVFDGIDSLSND